MAKLNPRIGRKLKQIPDVAVDAARQAMEEGAQEIVEEMRRQAPPSEEFRKRIGWAWPEDVPKGAMVIKEIRSGGNKGEQYATLLIHFFVRSGLPQGNWVEFGTQPHSVAKGADVSRGIKQDLGPHHPGATAWPFFFPAWDKLKPKFYRRVRSRVRAAIKEAWRNG